MAEMKNTPESGAPAGENKEYSVHVHLEGITHDAEGHHVRQDGSIVEFDHDHGAHSHDPNHPHVHSNKKAVLARLSRADGHLQSVMRMIDDDRDCAEVLIQLAAVRSAINNAGKVILHDHINECLTEAVVHGDVGKIDELNKAIEQFIK